jgi:hypothetical protein
VCAGSSATLTGSGATTYTWNPGALTGTNVVVTPTATTIYTVIGRTGTCSNTRTISLTVNPSPTVTAASSPTLICRGSSATLTAGGASTYTWNPGALTGSTTVVSPTVTTTYTVTGRSLTGCTNTRTVTLTVSNPTINAVANPTTLCAGNTATITGSGAYIHLESRCFIWNNCCGYTNSYNCLYSSRNNYFRLYSN